MFTLTGLFTAHVCFKYWPLSHSDRPAGLVLNDVNANLVYVLAFSQAIAIIFGVWQMIEQHRYFIKQGIEPLAKRMLQRYWESGLYVSMMAIMVYTYVKFLPTRSTSQGLDLFYLYGLLPAASMFYMFFNMISAASRFKQLYTPQLNMADQFLLQFGAQAVARTYTTTLAVFDLKGFKALDRLRYTQPRAAKAVEELMTEIEHDLLDLLPRERHLFRYKSNGDEFIMLVYAKDKEQGQVIYREMLEVWAMRRQELLTKWQRRLEADFPEAAVQLGMHVMMCTCNDVSITVRGPVDSPITRPDFLSSRFSQLTAAFKHATADRVAIYADDFEIVRDTAPFVGATYEPCADTAAGEHAAMGYIVLGDGPSTIKQIAA